MFQEFFMNVRNCLLLIIISPPPRPASSKPYQKMFYQGHKNERAIQTAAADQ
jgi:hypothetical protein